MKITYLDNAATTMIDPKVLDAMQPYLKEKYGNASSIHMLGQEANLALEQSRKIIARSIGADPEEIIFTSGGTESNNIALKSIAFNKKSKGNHIITTKIEHDCILNSCRWLEKQGFKITYLDVDKDGFIDIKQLKETIRPETILVSVIHANNEIGTIQNIKEIGKICKEKDILFHTDACQSFTKIDIDVKEQYIDLLTLNSHKIHGPKGIGALYIKKGTEISPWQHGGGHEFNIRSGTENIPAIIGFAKAAEIALKEKEKFTLQMKNQRDKLIQEILKIPGTALNGPKEKRLSNNINISFDYIEGESIAAMLDTEGICVSTGSACSSQSLEPSHVLMAIGKKEEQAHGSIRLTISRFTKEEEIDYTIKVIPDIIKRLRDISPLGKKEFDSEEENQDVPKKDN